MFSRDFHEIFHLQQQKIQLPEFIYNLFDGFILKYQNNAI